MKAFILKKTRNAAFREAKRHNNIPMCQQPTNVTKNHKNLQGKTEPGREYTFKNGNKTTTIRDDRLGHKFKDDPSQNRGPHFND